MVQNLAWLLDTIFFSLEGSDHMTKNSTVHMASQFITTRCMLLIVVIIVFQYIKQMVPTASHLDHKVMDLVSSRSQEVLLLLLAILVGADSGSHCIQSFQLVGSFIHKFGTKGSSKGQLNVIFRC